MAYKGPIYTKIKNILGEMQGIAKVEIGGIRCGVCGQSREERGTMLGVNLAGSKDRHTFSVGDDEQLFPGDLKFGKLAQQAP
ncbi:hypothetical protein Tco_0230633 [Tanacetum coccineum]